MKTNLIAIGPILVSLLGTISLPQISLSHQISPSPKPSSWITPPTFHYLQAIPRPVQASTSPTSAIPSPTPSVIPSPIATPLPALPTPIASSAPKSTIRTSATPSPIIKSVTQTPPTSVSTGNPLAGRSFYVNPNSSAQQQATVWRASDPDKASLLDKIANQPVATWLGDWNTAIQSDTNTLVSAAARQGTTPVLVAYSIPQRDCGSYSSGGSSSAEAYQTWISGLAQGIGQQSAVVILEPDALAGMGCLNTTDQNRRFSMLQQAVQTLKAQSKAIVYLDAGNSNWISASEMARRLTQAGIAQADGFSLNVSNFYSTTSNVVYGQQLSSLLGGKHFVIDTSRNGLGPTSDNQWCNPDGRALGERPTTATGSATVDAFLWIKAPGESDGQCNGGPAAGVWWPDYALGLAQRSAN